VSKSLKAESGQSGQKWKISLKRRPWNLLAASFRPTSTTRAGSSFRWTCSSTGRRLEMKNFVTSVDDRIARIYPISVWKGNEKVLEQLATEDPEAAEALAFVSERLRRRGEGGPARARDAAHRFAAGADAWRIRKSGWIARRARSTSIRRRNTKRRKQKAKEFGGEAEDGQAERLQVADMYARTGDARRMPGVSGRSAGRRLSGRDGGIGRTYGRDRQRLTSGFVIANDRDAESLEIGEKNTAQWADRIRYHHGSFSELRAALTACGSSEWMEFWRIWASAVIN
jgi:hypothetical protein